MVKLPTLTKTDIREHFDEFIACNSGYFAPIAYSTGGSTGEPLRFFIDVKSDAAVKAALWRGWSYAGYKFGDKMAVLSGLSLVPQEEASLKAAARKVIRKMAFFPTLNLNKEILSAYAKTMMKFKPKFIRGYPASIYFFADFLKENGIDGIRLKAVLTTAEMLFPYQRKLMSEVFQCDVLDGYGACDGGTAAFECQEHSGYHMFIERTAMEFVDDDGKQVAEGKNGRIVATDLFNYAMPFIRYDTGDMGTYSTEECACGRKLPLMKKILGRTTDTLRFKTGAVLSGPSLIHIMKDFDVKQYQIVQEKDDLLIVKLIKGETFVDKDAEQLYKILSSSAGEAVEIKFEFVESIPTTASGKWKFVISRS
jgi:phenylacetate-CoA ligase